VPQPVGLVVVVVVVVVVVDVVVEVEVEVEVLVDVLVVVEVGVVVVVWSPLHETPLNAKSVGVAFVPLYVAWKPNWALAPVASEPFHGMLDAVTCAPDCLTFALHPELIAWLPEKVQVSVHEVTGADWLVTVTLAVNPVDHWLSL
jgi:hypothetical protein